MPPEIRTQEEESSQKEETQPTNSQESPSTEEIEVEEDPRDIYTQSLEQRIAEQQIQQRKLETLLEKIAENNNKPAPTPQRDIETERKKFYNDPVGSLEEQFAARDNKILNQMREMLAPIQEVASSFRVDNEYTRMKNMIKVDPVFGKGLKDPDVEAAVDTIMKQPGVDVNENTIKSAIAQAMGIKMMGGLGNAPKPKPQNETRTDPPFVPTNRTRTTNREEMAKELTENDRLAMKYAGLKPGNPEHEKEYWKLVSDETMVFETHKKASK
jgi:hypothetical protein